MSHTGILRVVWLTHCILELPYGDINLVHHWLRWWLVTSRHQPITSINVDIPSVGSCAIHLTTTLRKSSMIFSKLLHKLLFFQVSRCWWDPSIRPIHWLPTELCVSYLTIIASDNDWSPGRRQAILWSNAGILFIGPLGTNLSEILIKIQTFSFKQMHLKMLPGKWQQFCAGLNVLTDPSFSRGQVATHLHYYHTKKILLRQMLETVCDKQ